MRGTPLDHSCGRVAKLALERRRVQQRCPRAPTPEPGKGRRPKNRQSSKAKRVSALVSWLLPVLGFACRGFPGSGSLVLRPCPFGFLFALVPPHVFSTGRGRHVPAPSGRDVGSSRGTDPRTGTGRRPKDRLLQVSLYVTTLLCTLSRLPCSSPSSLLLYFPKASPLPYLLTVAVLHEFFPFFGQLPGDFRREVISAVTADTCTASYLPEGGHGHYFYGP